MMRKYHGAINTFSLTVKVKHIKNDTAFVLWNHISCWWPKIGWDWYYVPWTESHPFLSLITEIASLWPVFLCPSAKVKCQLIISATQNVKGNDFSSSMPHHVAIVNGKSSQRLQDISAFHLQNLSRDLQIIHLYVEVAWRRFFKTTTNYFSTLRLMRSSFLSSRISKISNRLRFPAE